MNLQEFTQATFTGNKFNRLPRIICNDGFNMSVQGGYGIYSNPREATLSYSEMEIGFPSEKVETLMEYAEDKENPTETVYGYVPVEVIQKVIDAHGGINVKETIK